MILCIPFVAFVHRGSLLFTSLLVVPCIYVFVFINVILIVFIIIVIINVIVIIVMTIIAVYPRARERISQWSNDTDVFHFLH